MQFVHKFYPHFLTIDAAYLFDVCWRGKDFLDFHSRRIAAFYFMSKDEKEENREGRIGWMGNCFPLKSAHLWFDKILHLLVYTGR